MAGAGGKPVRAELLGPSPKLLGLSQLAEVEAGTELETRILDAMHRFVDRGARCCRIITRV
jgi:hypothetical protein